MTNSNQTRSGGIDLTGLLVFIVFLVLKLTDTIDWSWWWVTAPLWGVVALALAFIAIGVVMALIARLLP